MKKTEWKKVCTYLFPNPQDIETNHVQSRSVKKFPLEQCEVICNGAKVFLDAHLNICTNNLTIFF